MVQTRTAPQDDPVAVGDDGIVETEVETVRTRQRVAGPAGDVMPAPRTVASGQPGGYLETLPERLGAVMVAVLAGIEGLLGMRFILHAYGANPNSGFISFINDVSWLFARPFANAFNNRSWSQGVIEISTLVAMGFYLLLFAFIAMLITALAPRLRGKTGGSA